VRNLERAGAVAKTAHAEHGRILQLGATPKGVALLKRCRSKVQAVERAISGLVTPAEEVTVRRWLSAVAEALSEGKVPDGKLAKRRAGG
jgi:DNA-binding MarR family transcriptional regulator